MLFGTPAPKVAPAPPIPAPAPVARTEMPELQIKPMDAERTTRRAKRSGTKALQTDLPSLNINTEEVNY
mgnify:CR=1 FL=1